jgi:3D (Asp-Asp-Asp) domain-containing protein
MSTRYQSLIAVIMLLAIFASTTLTAQAGILDWFKSSDAKAQEPEAASLDSLYASIDIADEDEAPLLLANAVATVNSPASDGVQKTIRRLQWVQVSAYNSEVAQTDASPFITANGTHVRDGIVAANHLPFNTALKFKNCGGIDGDKIFIVTDRMNKRYQNNVDIWMEQKTDAVKFGRRSCQIEIIQ